VCDIRSVALPPGVTTWVVRNSNHALKWQIDAGTVSRYCCSCDTCCCPRCRLQIVD
jgi:hypothetical protein